MTAEPEESHWVRWHHRYDDSRSGLTGRLEMVQHHVSTALDGAAPGRPFRILSLCAGRGLDVINVVVDHPRRDDVIARLVELDPTLANQARDAARAAGLTNVEVVTGNAAITDAALGLAPAHLVLLCGIFGNISHDDIHRCIEMLPTVCAARGVVVWTRHRIEPDFTTTVRSWFGMSGFEELGFGSPDGAPLTGVGAHRLIASPRPFEPGVRLFRFVGDGSEA